MHKIFRYPNFFEILKRWHDFFRHSETKNVRRKNVIHLFIHKTFWNQNFFNNSSIPFWNFSVLWDNIFSIDIYDIPLLCLEFSDTRKFLKHRRVPRQTFSALWDENVSSQNRDTPLHKV